MSVPAKKRSNKKNKMKSSAQKPKLNTKNTGPSAYKQILKSVAHPLNYASNIIQSALDKLTLTDRLHSLSFEQTQRFIKTSIKRVSASIKMPGNIDLGNISKNVQFIEEKLKELGKSISTTKEKD